MGRYIKTKYYMPTFHQMCTISYNVLLLDDSRTPRSSFNVKYSSDRTPYRTQRGFVIFQIVLFLMELKFKGMLCEKMHMASILMRYRFIWHSDKPYRTRLQLVRYDLSECHLNPYRTQMDTISWNIYILNLCIISYNSSISRVNYNLWGR